MFWAHTKLRVSVWLQTTHSYALIFFLIIFKSVCTCLCGLFKMRNQQVYKKHFGFYLSQLLLKLQYIVIFYILEIKVKMQ